MLTLQSLTPRRAALIGLWPTFPQPSPTEPMTRAGFPRQGYSRNVLGNDRTDRDAATEHRHVVRDAAQPSIGSTVTSDTPIHDWLRPRLADLVQQAERAGFLREAVVAVIMDLMTAPPYDDAPPPVE